MARCAAVEVAVTGACGAAGRALVLDVAGSATHPDPAQAVVALCELVLVACLLWAWAATTAVVAEVVRDRGHPPSRAGAPLGVPRAWRRWVLVACGVALTAGIGVPAQATNGSGQPDPTGRRADALLAGLPLPERAVGRGLDAEHGTTHRTEQSARPTTRPVRPPALPPTLLTERPPPPTEPSVDTVVVGRGDSLWLIAARTLPAGAEQGAVEERWQAIYQDNRATLGPDPDRISPGQRLTLPPG